MVSCPNCEEAITSENVRVMGNLWDGTTVWLCRDCDDVVLK
ncbi:hypothetical protein [Halorussus salinisoli]|nr:hypothetical protein [Halorussus salinisoli]